jgi:hypothetical protein
MRKRILSVGLMLVLVFSANACSGKSQVEQNKDRIEVAVPVEEFYQNESTPEPTAEPEPEVIDLKLPLVVQEKTIFIDSGTVLRINSEGVLEEGKSANNTNSAYGEWKQIDTDVRSIESDNFDTIFYIKNDNTLWGYGSNENGRLGDGTGLDRDEPVFILEDVARIKNLYDHGIYAIKTDKSLWMWGDGINYAPVFVSNNTVDVQLSQFLMSSMLTAVHESSGYVKSINKDNKTVDSIGHFYDFTISQYTEAWVKNDKKFWVDDNEITDNVVKFNLYYSDRNQDIIFLFKDDDSLWGFGENDKGYLGDGTKVPRKDKAVKISDNVIAAGTYWYLKDNGEYWVWNSDNPTPLKLLDNVATVLVTRYAYVYANLASVPKSIILKDGTCIVDLNAWLNGTNYNGNVVNDPDFVINNVKVPQTLTFN